MRALMPASLSVASNYAAQRGPMHGLGQQDDRLDMPVGRHDEIAFQPSHIEIKVQDWTMNATSMLRDHLERGVAGRGGAVVRKRRARQDPRRCWRGCRRRDTSPEPESPTREAPRESAGMHESAGKPRRRFVLRIPDEVLVAIDRRYPGDGAGLGGEDVAEWRTVLKSTRVGCAVQMLASACGSACLALKSYVGKPLAVI